MLPTQSKADGLKMRSAKGGVTPADSRAENKFYFGRHEVFGRESRK